MKFHIITIFPKTLEEYFNSSILGRAQKKGLIKINLINPRDFATDKHKKTDERPFGGGPGMVMKIEPIIKAVDSVLSRKGNLRIGGEKIKIILFSPAGKKFNQKMARDWMKKYDNIIMISGRYEGVDARVKKILKAEEVSIGDYVLTGGELPSAVVVDAVSRHIPGVLGKEESLEENRGLGFQLYTKPEVFEFGGKKYSTPKILLSGDHQKIKKWKEENSKKTDI